MSLKTKDLFLGTIVIIAAYCITTILTPKILFWRGTALYNDKKDYSFMCMELLLAVMICVYKDESCFDNSSVDVNIFENLFITRSVKKQPVFVNFFAEKFKKMNFVLQKNFDETKKFYVLPQKVGLYGAILYSWYWLHEPNPTVVVQMENSFFYSPILKGYEELKKFAEMIKMMS